MGMVKGYWWFCMVIFMDNHLIALTLGNSFNQSLHSVTLPKSLPGLTFGNDFNQSVERSPFWRELYMDMWYDIYIWYDIGMIYMAIIYGYDIVLFDIDRIYWYDDMIYIYTYIWLWSSFILLSMNTLWLRLLPPIGGVKTSGHNLPLANWLVPTSSSSHNDDDKQDDDDHDDFLAYILS